MTVKGIFGYRLVFAACLFGVGILLGVDGISALQEARRPFVALLELGLASVHLPLGARSLMSRVEIRRGRAVLFSVLRTIGVDAADIRQVTRRKFIGWHVLAFELSDGRSIRLPLLTQPGDPKKLDSQQELIATAVRRETGSAPSTF